MARLVWLLGISSPGDAAVAVLLSGWWLCLRSALDVVFLAEFLVFTQIVHYSFAFSIRQCAVPDEGTWELSLNVEWQAA